MERNLLLGVISLLSMMLIACNTTIEVESVSVDPEIIELNINESKKLTATVFPENADDSEISWKSDDISVASVDQSGNVTAVKAGETKVWAMCAGGCSAYCTVKVVETPPVLGDYYYNDGTWSTELDSEKTPIGVVFFVGDPTAEDPALKKDHPECTHGLVIALTEVEERVKWMETAEEYGKAIGDWVEENAKDYISPVTDCGIEDNLNKIIGYNNTKAIEAFNKANPSYVVNAVEAVAAYRESCKAPELSSDWYLPSCNELSIMCMGVYDGNIWDITGTNIENQELINSRIKEVSDADLIQQDFYWSSSEDTASQFAYGEYTDLGQPGTTSKINSNLVRCVLAF